MAQAKAVAGAGVEIIEDAQYCRIPLELIDPNPYQPRKFFDRRALEALAASLQSIGQLEDILVRPRESGRFQIVLGERRWQAAQLAGFRTINAKIRAFTDEETFTISLTENVQREELTSVEEAFAFKSFIDQGMTQEKVAAHLGKLHDRVGDKLKVLSSSYYVRYLEDQLREADQNLASLRREVARLSPDGRYEVRKVDERGLLEALGDGWELITALGNEYVVRSKGR